MPFFNTSNGRIYVYGTVVSSKKAHFNSLNGLFPKNGVICNRFYVNKSILITADSYSLS